jgi:hypothetical protein
VAKGPNKGFFKELEKTPAKKKEGQRFDWKKPVSQVAKAEAMATPHRMREFKSVKEKQGQLVSETATHIKNRRAGK